MTPNEPPPQIDPMAEADDVPRRDVLSGLRHAAIRAAVTGALATGGLTIAGSARAQALTDNDYFNYLLNLSYLSAEYHLHAIQGGSSFGFGDLPFDLIAGVGLATPGQVNADGGLGGLPVTNPHAAVFTLNPVAFQSAAVAAYAQRFAVSAQAHVRFLRAVLYTTAVARPELDVGPAFAAFFVSAGLIAPGQDFNPLSGDVAYLLGAYVLQDVFVTAVAGVIRLLNNPDTIEAAAGLLAAESYAAGAIRTLLANFGAGAATDAIAAYRAQLSGKADDAGTQGPGHAYDFLATDVNALVFRRTPQQVLAIVYNGGVGKGGFFPAGMTGAIT